MLWKCKFSYSKYYCISIYSQSITLKGIDSAESSIDYKSYLWSKLASEWKVDLHKSTKMIALDELSLEIDKILRENKLEEF
ncbi:MAG: hypothetical protein CM15mP126_4410 [Gammaproteobacteria bacterium]|nr:MAG: hypothetical protein CM15mP126_4410 [Gammaproteobacteria bacterium]